MIPFVSPARSAYQDLPQEEKSPNLSNNGDKASDLGNGPLTWDPTPQQQRRRQRTRIWIASTLIILITFTLIAFAIQAIARRHGRSTAIVPSTPIGEEEVVETQETIQSHCGNSPLEAESLGCVFDLMTYGWLHPTCYNSTMSHEWEEEYGPWRWTTEKHGDIEVPYDQLKYTPVVFGPQGYHVVHCLYTFKLLHLASINGYQVSGEAGPLSHTDHCTGVIAHPTTYDPFSVNTRIKNQNLECMKLAPS